MNDENTSSRNPERGSGQRAELTTPVAGTRAHAVDEYLARMARAIADGRVRFDDPRDLDAVVRLKAFVEGWPCMRAARVGLRAMPRELVIQVEEMLARWESAVPAVGREVR